MTMHEQGSPVRIAVNVMRARLTVLGFNIAVASFQIERLYNLPGGIHVPGVDYTIHAGSQASLLLAIAVSFAAMVAYIYSTEYDEQGTCTSWTLIAGDILMYLGLAYTVAGFFSPLEMSLNFMESQQTGQSLHFSILHDALLAAGGVSWFLAAYVGPIRALLKSPFSRATNACLAVAYMIVFGCLGVISANAAAIDQGSATAISLSQWLLEFAQPFRW